MKFTLTIKFNNFYAQVKREGNKSQYNKKFLADQ